MPTLTDLASFHRWRFLFEVFRLLAAFFDVAHVKVPMVPVVSELLNFIAKLSPDDSVIALP